MKIMEGYVWRWRRWDKRRTTRDRVRVVSLLEESLIPLSLRGVVFAHHENYGGVRMAMAALG